MELGINSAEKQKCSSLLLKNLVVGIQSRSGCSETNRYLHARMKGLSEDFDPNRLDVAKLISSRAEILSHI